MPRGNIPSSRAAYRPPRKATNARTFHELSSRVVWSICRRRLPGSGLSYTHLEKPHREVPIARAAEPLTDPGVPQGTAWRGFLWIGLIVATLVIAIGRLTTPAPPVQMPTPPRTLAQTAAQAAAQAVDDEKLAEAKSPRTVSPRSATP